MSRNAESRFSMLPNVDIRRSKLKRDSTHKTTFNAGKLVPIFLEQDVLPGDTHTLRTGSSIRMATPIHPVMDNLYLDVYYFFVPYRLIWSEFEEFMGENKTGPWTTGQKELQVPHISNLSANFSDSIADHLGIPIGIETADLSVSALPFRAYAKIWNDWFRSEVVDYPIPEFVDSEDRMMVGKMQEGEGSDLEDLLYGMAVGCNLAPVSKFSDYFTRSLPEPQKGEDVLLPMAGSAPVLPTNTLNDVREGSSVGVLFRRIDTGNYVGITGKALATNQNGSLTLGDNINIPDTTLNVAPANLNAILSEATAVSINQLREAMALQRFFETNARYGTRYTEILRGHFGVRSPDSRLQRSEYIGGKRININMQQVLQTSATDTVSPQGNASAFSWTVDVDDSFTYSSVEHGIILGLACVRSAQTYQYGIERGWSRRDLTDFYFPTFAHIGEQAILNKEIYALAPTSEQLDEVFGYQEAWAEYRYKNNIVSGAFRSNAQSEEVGGTLDSWHYAEKLDSLPTLSSEWLHQSALPIDRTLAVSNTVAPQFLADFAFNLVSVRPMPVYSIPGLASHF